MIAVFGATGKVGGKVAAMLLESGISVRALVRSAEKAAPLKNRGAQLVIGSLNNQEDIVETLNGCDGAFLMTPMDRSNDKYIDEEIQIGRNYGSALKDSDIGHIVYMSVIGARDNTGIPFFDSKSVVEDSIILSGVDSTILRPVFFMENLYSQIPIVQQHGMMSLPFPSDWPFNMIATEDIAYAAVQSLRRGGKGELEAYDMLGPRKYRMTEVAEILSKAIGKPVKYQQASFDQTEQILLQTGMSTTAAKDYIKMFDVYSHWDIQGDRNRVYEEFNFEPTTLETIVNSIAGALAVETR
jgi:uncharacterized protein YbjT (DUF2867 family)